MFLWISFKLLSATITNYLLYSFIRSIHSRRLARNVQKTWFSFGPLCSFVHFTLFQLSSKQKQQQHYEINVFFFSFLIIKLARLLNSIIFFCCFSFCCSLFICATDFVQRVSCIIYQKKKKNIKKKYIYNVKEKEHWGKELFQYLNDMSSSGSKIIKILSFALSFFTWLDKWKF